ncbi:hypothetical protein [Burkholderia ubonensis]|uniref:hypothetical protein n=1 Tax=Burkholderia ubonensis TaxID=101571 RepID=UPI000AAC22C4|nr:hypothetical protein [Burkholderia ubonensis]
MLEPYAFAHSRWPAAKCDSAPNNPSDATSLIHVSASIGYIFGVATFLLLATVMRIGARFFAWMGVTSYSN